MHSFYITGVYIWLARSFRSDPLWCLGLDPDIAEDALVLAETAAGDFAWGPADPETELDAGEPALGD